MEDAARDGETDATIMPEKDREKPNAATLEKRQDTHTNIFCCT